MQVLHVVSLEGHRAVEHGIEDNTGAPQVSLEARVATVPDDLWGDVGGGTTLLPHDLSCANLFAYTEICNLDHALAI